ncbi:DUF6931 family protein [Neptunicoccus cionae]|uniref:Uncharacterized protein n=1 Tax=Neptunicoccus cionae TaxID=2035344 RepID=A0A916QSQ5_9RHOB|nr:hypothetical protein [Amylibacter cionae]GGA10573.1 hypothetical protein GCM10011498_08360 [Amylibacter cionae]
MMNQTAETATPTPDFSNLKKIADRPFGPFCAEHKIKIDPALAIAPDISVSDGLAALYAARVVPSYLHVMAHALPVRESVWLACHGAALMLPVGAEPSEALQVARAWVYHPNLETRAAVQKVIEQADPDDPTLMAADAAFHGIAKGMEEEVKSAPSATPTLVFAVLLNAALKDEDQDQAEANWQELVAISVDIASGGTGEKPQ